MLIPAKLRILKSDRLFGAKGNDIYAVFSVALFRHPKRTFSLQQVLIKKQRSQLVVTVIHPVGKIELARRLRIVSIGQGMTEILFSLGLADKVVGTAVWIGPVLPEFADANSKINRLADNDPSFESVVGQEPDLMATTMTGDGKDQSDTIGIDLLMRGIPPAQVRPRH